MGGLLFNMRENRLEGMSCLEHVFERRYPGMSVKFIKLSHKFTKISSKTDTILTLR
jgi:hypothetical protein